MASCVRLPVAVVSRWARGYAVPTGRLESAPAARRAAACAAARLQTASRVDTPVQKSWEPRVPRLGSGRHGAKSPSQNHPAGQYGSGAGGRTLYFVSPLTRRTGCVRDTKPRLERGIGSSDSRSDSPSRHTQGRPLLSSGGPTGGHECGLFVGPCPFDPGRPHPAAAADARIGCRGEPHRGKPPRNRVLAVAAHARAQRRAQAHRCSGLVGGFGGMAAQPPTPRSVGGQASAGQSVSGRHVSTGTCTAR